MTYRPGSDAETTLRRWGGDTGSIRVTHLADEASIAHGCKIGALADDLSTWLRCRDDVAPMG